MSILYCLSSNRPMKLLSSKVKLVQKPVGLLVGRGSRKSPVTKKPTTCAIAVELGAKWLTRLSWKVVHHLHKHLVDLILCRTISTSIPSPEGSLQGVSEPVASTGSFQEIDGPWVPVKMLCSLGGQDSSGLFPCLAVIRDCCWLI